MSEGPKEARRRPRFGEGGLSFRPIEELAATVGPLDPASQDYVQDWISLTSELQAMVPHLAQLIVRSMGRLDTWQEFSEAERNIWGYTAASLLAEAHRLARAHPSQTDERHHD
jgi:hypothetical protein